MLSVLFFRLTMFKKIDCFQHVKNDKNSVYMNELAKNIVAKANRRSAFKLFNLIR